MEQKVKNDSRDTKRFNSRAVATRPSAFVVPLAIVMLAAALLSTCGMFHLPDPLAEAKAANAANAAAAGTAVAGAAGSASSGSSAASGMGTISISVPRVSSVILQALGITADAASRTVVYADGAASGAGRAFLLASRVDFILKEATEAYPDVAWSSGEMQGLQAGAPIIKTIPAGEYTLIAEVYNSQVDASIPVATGTSDFTVAAGQSTAVAVPCVPNTELEGLVQEAAPGTSMTGSLKPIMISPSGDPLSFTAGEKWYLLTIPGSTFIRLSFNAAPPDTMAVASISAQDGHNLGACSTANAGFATFFNFPYDTMAVSYYIGVATATSNSSLATVSYTLNATPILPRESLVNGDFSAGAYTGWKLYTWEGMTAAYTVEAGEGVVSNIGTTGNGSLKQKDFTLIQGESYRIGFKARVDSGTGRLAINLMGGGFPDGRYYHDWPTEVDTEMQTFDYHFTWTEPTTQSAFVDIYLNGCAGKTLRLDDSALEKIPNPLAQPIISIGTAVLATIVGKTVPLNWDEIPGVTGYRLYRYENGTGYEIYRGTQTDYVDAWAKENTTYTYKVRAVSGTALGPFSNALEASTGVGAPLSGTIIQSGTNGDRYMVFMDGLALTYSSTIAFNSGTGIFSINAGAPLKTPWNLVAWFDGNMNKLLDPGEYISRVDEQIWELNPTGTYEGLMIDTFVQAMDKPVLAKPAIKPDKKVFVRFFEPRTDGSLLRALQKSSDGGSSWLNITVTDKGGNNNLYWLGYYDPSLTAGVNYIWRVGTDLNSNGIVDESEYGVPTDPAQWYTDTGELTIEME